MWPPMVPAPATANFVYPDMSYTVLVLVTFNPLMIVFILFQSQALFVTAHIHIVMLSTEVPWRAIIGLRSGARLHRMCVGINCTTKVYAFTGGL